MAQRNRDPGLVFEYEDERYGLGHLRPPHDTSEDAHPPGMAFSHKEFLERIFKGTCFLNQYSEESITTILNNLVAAGDAAQTDEGGWVMTQQGFDKLTGPNGYDPGPLPPHKAEAMLAADELTQDEYDAWKEAHDAHLSEPGPSVS